MSFIKELKKRLTDAGVKRIVTNIDRICEPANVPTPVVAIITPKVAVRLLGNTDMAKQRHISPRDVTKYAKAMKSGKWVLNYEALQQDTDGNMINGRNRLEACIVADVPFPTLLVKGTDYDTTMDTLDTGKNRTKGNILQLLLPYVKYSVSITAGLDFLHGFNAGRYARSHGNHTAMTNANVREWVEANEAKVYDLENYAADVQSIKNKLASTRMLIGMWYIFDMIDHTKATAFMTQFLRGTGLEATSPILYIRNRFDQARTINRVRKSQGLTYREKLGMMIRAWNDFYSNGNVMSVRTYHMHRGKLPTVDGLDGIELYNLPEGWEVPMDDVSNDS